MATKPNMTVAVTVMVSISEDEHGELKATGSYSGVSVPPALPCQTVVSPDGQINLQAIDRKNDIFKKMFSNDTNIFFYLGVIWPYGNCFPYNPGNMSDASNAISINDKKGDKDKYAASLINPWTLLLVDTDHKSDCPEYTLKVAINKTGKGDIVILEIDPVIINRGVED